MSRTFPNTVLKRSLAAESAMPVQFIRFAFGGGDIRVTTAPFDIDWDGFTWQGIGGQLTIEAIRETPDDRGGQMTLRLSGVDQSMLSAILAEQYIGRVVEIWFGWVAQGTNLCPNSGGETDLNNLISTGTLARSQAVTPYEGDWVVRCTAINADGSGVNFRAAGGGLYPVIPGMSYSVSARARTGQANLKLTLFFWDAGITTVVGSATYQVQVSGNWWPLEVNGVAPSTAAWAECLLTTDGAQGVFDFYADALQFNPGSKPDPYQPTDGAAIIGGTILDRPLGPMSFFMNGGFEVTESPGDREGGTVDVEGRVVSRLASLLQPRGFRTNRESHQTVYRTDQFFEFVPGLAGREVTWGWTKKLLIASFNKRIRRWFD
jgi:hypothetical protein